MKKKFLLFPLAAAIAFSAAFGLAGCVNEGENNSGGDKVEDTDNTGNNENTNGSDNKPEHTTHTYDKKVTEAKYLKSEADCLHKAVYYFSCECGEKGENTFESGEFGAHKYADGVCGVCSQPDPSAKRTTVTKEEWEKAFSLKNYDNVERIVAVFDKANTEQDYGKNITRVDGDKFYFAVCDFEISTKPPYEILSEPPYTIVFDEDTHEKLEFYYADKNCDEAKEFLYEFADYLPLTYDKFIYDEQNKNYVWNCTEDTEVTNPNSQNEELATMTIRAGDKVTVAFENGKPVRVDMDFNNEYNDVQALFVLYNYGGITVTLPESEA